jgi:hypothetical protein
VSSDDGERSDSVLLPLRLAPQWYGYLRIQVTTTVYP